MGLGSHQPKPQACVGETRGAQGRMEEGVGKSRLPHLKQRRWGPGQLESGPVPPHGSV